MKVWLAHLETKREYCKNHVSEMYGNLLATLGSLSSAEAENPGNVCREHAHQRGSDSGSSELDRRACLEERVGTFGQPVTVVPAHVRVAVCGPVSVHYRLD